MRFAEQLLPEDRSLPRGAERQQGITHSSVCPGMGYQPPDPPRGPLTGRLRFPRPTWCRIVSSIRVGADKTIPGLLTLRAHPMLQRRKLFPLMAMIKLTRKRFHSDSFWRGHIMRSATGSAGSFADWATTYYRRRAASAGIPAPAVKPRLTRSRRKPSHLPSSTTCERWTLSADKHHRPILVGAQRGETELPTGGRNLAREPLVIE